jgi:hypothetical protein
VSGEASHLGRMADEASHESYAKYAKYRELSRRAVGLYA